MDGESELRQYLTCDVELNIIGPTPALNNKGAADALRALADRVEKGEFDDGFHDVKDRGGNPIGSIYVDYSGG